MKYALLILALVSGNPFNSATFLKKEKELIVLQLTSTGKHINYIYKFDLKGKLKSFENPGEKVMLNNEGKSGKVITRFKYNLNGKVREQVRKREISLIEEELRFRRVYEYNKENKLIWESYTKANNENDIRTTEYSYNKEGLLQEIKEENLEDKNRQIIYDYNYLKNNLLESITFKVDTSDFEITYKEDKNKAIITCYDINSDQKKLSYSTFYIKNAADQIIEYKFTSEQYGNTNTHSIYKYSKNKLLEQVHTNYGQKENIYKFTDKYEYKNKRHIKNLDEDVIININKKLIEINNSSQSIWKLVNILKQ